MTFHKDLTLIFISSFGFMDGISQPAVQGVDQNPPPQGPQGPIPQGYIHPFLRRVDLGKQED